MQRLGGAVETLTPCPRVAASPRRRSSAPCAVFAALGDETRLSLLARLCERARLDRSCEGAPSRGRDYKHLRVWKAPAWFERSAGRSALNSTKPLEKPKTSDSSRTMG